MFPEPGLRTRIAVGLVGIGLATALAFGLGAYWAADIMEVLVLEDNIGELAQRSARAIAAGESPPLPAEDWYYTRRQSDPHLEPELGQLQNGSHHDVLIGTREHHVWVQPLPDDRLFLIYDLTEIEEYESQLIVFLVSIGVIGGVLAFGAGLWLTPWIARPLTALANRVMKLPRHAHRLSGPEQEDADLAILAEAINSYLEENHELIERERAFTGMASHELRNPVATILAATDLIELQEHAPHVALPLQRIRRSARRMDKLIDVLLDLARRDSDGNSTDESCRPAALIAALLDDLSTHADAADKKLELDLDDSVQLATRPAMFEVVAANLINNAFDHSTGPNILIRLNRSGRTVESEGGEPQANRSGRLGLSIVDVICSRLGWRFEYRTAASTTTASVHFG